MKKDWIKRLPPGEYTLRQILEFANLKSTPSAKTVLLNHGAQVKSVRIEGTNLMRNVFIWKGHKLGIKIIDTIIESLDEEQKACLLKEIANEKNRKQ